MSDNKVFLAILESKSEGAITNVLSQIKSFTGVNLMFYKINDDKLRIVFAALEEAAR